MNIVSCPKGHFFDAEKFEQCPHCKELDKQKNEEAILELLKVSDNKKTKEIKIKAKKDGEILAGRDYHSCDMILENEYTARQQAKFILKNGCWYIKDLNSMNGTYLNDQKLPVNTECLLKNNDEISFANRETYIFVGEKFYAE